MPRIICPHNGEPEHQPQQQQHHRNAPLSRQNPVKAAVGGIGLFRLVYRLGGEGLRCVGQWRRSWHRHRLRGVLLPRLFQCIGQCGDFKEIFPWAAIFVQFRFRFQQPSGSPFPLKSAEVFRQFVLDLFQWLFQLFRNGTGQRLRCRLV